MTALPNPHPAARAYASLGTTTGLFDPYDVEAVSCWMDAVVRTTVAVLALDDSCDSFDTANRTVGEELDEYDFWALLAALDRHRERRKRDRAA